MNPLNYRNRKHKRKKLHFHFTHFFSKFSKKCCVFELVNGCVIDLTNQEIPPSYACFFKRSKPQCERIIVPVFRIFVTGYRTKEALS